MAKISDDEQKFADSYRRVMMVTAYVMFPMMAGLIATAEEIYTLLLKPDWHPAIPYFRVMCVIGFFYPIAMVAYNVLKVKSDGAIILRLEIIKRVIMTIILCVTIPQSVMAVTWGLVAAAVCEMMLNIFAAKRYSGIGIMRFISTLLPITLLTGAMYATVHFVGVLAQDWGILLRLLAMIASGIFVYLAGSWITRMEAFKELCGIAKRILNKKGC